MPFTVGCQIKKWMLANGFEKAAVNTCFDRAELLLLVESKGRSEELKKALC